MKKVLLFMITLLNLSNITFDLRAQDAETIKKIDEQTKQETDEFIRNHLDGIILDKNPNSDYYIEDGAILSKRKDYNDPYYEPPTIKIVPSEEMTRLLSSQCLQQSSGKFSLNGMYTFMLFSDGEIALSNLKTFRSIWSSNTHGKAGTPPYKLCMQDDGNLVAYNGNGQAFWASDTYHIGSGPYKFVVESDGTALIYDGNNNITWSTKNSLSTNQPKNEAFANNSVPEKEVNFTNNSKQDVYIVIAYYTGSDWSSKGWYNVKPGASAICFRQPYNWDRIYWYAEDEKGGAGLRWEGSDAKFCISRPNPFEFTKQDCSLPVGFHLLILAGNSTNQILIDSNK